MDAADTAMDTALDTDVDGWDARHAAAERGPGGRAGRTRPVQQRTGEADTGALAEAGHVT
jgi:hypothetical protein